MHRYNNLNLLRACIHVLWPPVHATFDTVEPPVADGTL